MTNRTTRQASVNQTLVLKFFNYRRGKNLWIMNIKWNLYLNIVIQDKSTGNICMYFSFVFVCVYLCFNERVGGWDKSQKCLVLVASPVISRWCLYFSMDLHWWSTHYVYTDKMYKNTDNTDIFKKSEWDGKCTWLQ